MINYLERNPIIETKKTSIEIGYSYNSVSKYINILCDKDILSETSKVGKTKIYSYTEYLNILRKDT